MKFTDKCEHKRSNDFSFFEFIVAAFEWCKIVFASLIVGLIGWFIIYHSNPNNTTKAIGIGVVIASLFVGIYLATNIVKGTEKANSNYLTSNDDDERAPKK